MSSEETKISIEEFLDVGLASLLPDNPNTGEKFTVAYRRIGVKVEYDGEGKKTKTCVNNYPAKDLLTIEREKGANQFEVAPLKNKVPAADRCYNIHAWCVPGLVVFDYDEDGDISNPLIPDILRTLPYTISLSGKGYHFYAMCSDLPTGDDERFCSRSGFPRRHVGALVNPDIETTDRHEEGKKKGHMKCAFGDFFSQHTKFKTDPKSGETSPNTTGIYERASTKGNAQYVFNWQGSIPEISFTDFERYLDPEFVWKEDKKADEKARDKKAADRAAKWNPMEGSGLLDMERGFTAPNVMWLLEHIDPNRELTGGWLQVLTFLKQKCGMDATYPIFEDAFEVFKTWSEPSSRYIESTIRGHWDSVESDVINFGTLVVYAKQDAGEAVVNEYMAERFKDAVSSLAADYSELGIARILRYFLNGCVCDTKQKDNKKRLFQCKHGNIWHSIDDVTVCKIIIENVIPEMQSTLETFYNLKVEYENEDDEEKVKIMDSKIDYIRTRIFQLKSHDNRQAVFKSLCDIEAYVSGDNVPLSRKWDDREETRYLFPFNNTTFFLREGRFGDVEPEKFIKYTTGYPWPMDSEGNAIMPPQEDIDYILESLQSIFVDEDQMRYMLTLFAANMEGENVFQEIYFLTGGGNKAASGGNGKGILFDMISSAFGSDTSGDSGFYGQMNPVMFQEKEKASGPAPELANHSQRRILSTSEPAKRPWNAAMLKRIVDEMIMCRKLQSGDDSYKAKWALFNQTNDDAPMDNMDGGMIRRMTFMALCYKFIDAGQTDPSHHLYNSDLDERVCKVGDRSLKAKVAQRRFGRAFFIILTRVYTLYVKDTLTGPGIKTPASMSIKNKEGRVIFPKEWSAQRDNFIDASDDVKAAIFKFYVIHPGLEKEWADGVLTKGQTLTAKLKKHYDNDDWYSSIVKLSKIYDGYVSEHQTGAGYMKKEGDIRAKLVEMGLYFEGELVLGLKKRTPDGEYDPAKQYDMDQEKLDDAPVILNQAMRDGIPLNQIFVPTGPGSFVMSIKYGSGQEPAPEPKQKIVVPPTPKQSVAEKIKKEVEKTSPRDLPDAGVGTGLLPEVGSESSTDRHSSDEETEEDEEEEDDNGSVLSDSDEEEQRQIAKLMDELA